MVDSEEMAMGKFVAAVVVAGMGAVVALALPDIKRYLRLRNM